MIVTLSAAEITRHGSVRRAEKTTDGLGDYIYLLSLYESLHGHRGYSKMAWFHISLLALSSLSHAVIFKPQNDFKSISGKNASFAVDLKPFFNNRGFGMEPNDADFDGSGSESTGR